MKRVLQHSKTGLYLTAGGGFSRSVADAQICPNLAAAMLVCASLRVNPTEFVYRVIQSEDAILHANFESRCFAA